MTVRSTWQAITMHTFDSDPNAGAGNAPVQAGDYGVLDDGAGDVQFFLNLDGTATGWYPALIAGAFANGTPVPVYVLRTAVPAGVGSTVIGPMPARVNGWKLINAWTRTATGGVIGGTAQVFDAAGGNAMTNVLVPGDGDSLTMAAAIVAAEEDVAGGDSPVWTTIAGTPAFGGYTMWVGL